MRLKKLTWENHRRAERSWFAKYMFSGDISRQDYSCYLKQQYLCYKALEDKFNSLESEIYFPDSRLKRAESIYQDLLELCHNSDQIPVFQSTENYIHYILHECPEDLLYAHVYVRYLGDLKGGQMIAKKVPGSGKYYQFEEPDKLEMKIRAKLRDDDVFIEEANKCFIYANDLFVRMQEHLQYGKK
ncbi:MAG: hypothetical protein CBD58_04435 [bacterium TMED198]|nr:MAG: hypothetical protein CBD58_04435 [bacterium TMED198]|tara:strand:+ start:4644 stop:5201 length:558 start_codon:yes stop_codon:yes gene_type:complete